MTRLVSVSLMLLAISASNQMHAQVAADGGREMQSPGAIDVGTSLRKAPWFDAESEQATPIKVNPRIDDSIHRDSRWTPKPRKLRRARKPTTTATGGGGGGLFGTGFTLGNLLGWVLLVVLMIGIIGAIAYVMSRAELQFGGNADANSDSAKDGLPDAQMLERIKHLPPELRRTDVNLRTECERLMKENRFDQAIILLLGHQLLLLDQNGLLRLNRGKTNGRYVRETRSHDPQSAAWLRETADAFEQSYFGRHDIPQLAFQQLWRQNEELETTARRFGAGE